MKWELTDEGQRLDAILNQVYQVGQYERWLLTQQRSSDREPSRDYLFSDERARFEPRKEDVVALAAGLTLVAEGEGVALRDARTGTRIGLPGVGKNTAERILATIDGHRCLLEVRLDANATPDEFARFLRATFGLVLFCPEAVAALERALPSVELIRFPTVPYAVERPYWENMIGVRELFAGHLREGFATLDPASFVTLIRKLHVLALMGAKLDSFYKPRSPISDRIVAPGMLYQDETRIRPTRRGPLYLDGPRVNLSAIGGQTYHLAIYESLGDAEALGESRSFEAGGLDWGRFLLARSERESEPQPWFFPPRPIRAEHWELLRLALAESGDAAAQRDRGRLVSALARFHQGFVRLHPFHCANQSIAMNMVNCLLSASQGAGMPHWILDHMALRLSTRAYEALFERCVRAWVVVDEDPVHRFATLRERKTRALSLLRHSAEGSSPPEFARACAADREGARWLLLE